MKKLTTTVTYKVPDGLYCNHTMQKSTPLTRCRFCTDLGKHGFTCVLHNEQLASTGPIISKCGACLKKQGVVEDIPSVKPKELMKYAVLEYRRIYFELIKQGIPEALADKMAQEEVLR
jgi:hypothetical protein